MKGSVMHRHTAGLGLFAFVLWAMLFALPAAAQEHTLNFDRERPVGSKFRIQARGEKQQVKKQWVDGKFISDETQKASGSLTAVAEVLALHENKTVQRTALKIEAYEAMANGKPVAFDTTQRIIASAKEGKTTFTYEDGSALPAGAANVLLAMANFVVDAQPDRPTRNAVYKLDQPRAVGTSWECDNALLVKAIAPDGELVFDLDEFESSFEFVGVAEFAGQKAAAYDVTAEFEEFTLAGADEVGLSVVNSEGAMSMSGLIPLDQTSGDGVMRLTLEMDLLVELKSQGKTVRLGFVTTSQADAEFHAVE